MVVRRRQSQTDGVWRELELEGGGGRGRRRGLRDEERWGGVALQTRRATIVLSRTVRVPRPGRLEAKCDGR